jgi:rare lipoprotein A
VSARFLFFLSTLLLTTACSSPGPRVERAEPAEAQPAVPAKPNVVLKRGGGYYQDDGPADEIPVDLDAIPDAEPRWEPLHRGALRPYVVLGKTYTPDTQRKSYRARGIASWYGRKFHGKLTSNGERYDMFAMTAAHTTLPLPSYARVTHLASGRSVVVRVNDRGPFHDGRVIDLSYTAAYKLGLIGNGSGEVEVVAILPGDETATRYAEVAPAPAPAAQTPARSAEPVRDLAAMDALIARLDPADVAVPPAPPLADNGRFYVQLGAFSNADNADSLRDRLDGELDWLGPRAVVVRRAGALHRVQAGPYANRADAETVITRIQRELGFRPTLAIQ